MRKNYALEWIQVKRELSFVIPGSFKICQNCLWKNVK
jgi:hypothetical protein